MRDYTKIVAWQRADDLTVAVYSHTRGFPRDEIYGLTSQLRRAAYSVPANIAEGSAREGKRDYLRFLYIARGSLAEAQYYLHLANKLGYLAQGDYDALATQVKELAARQHVSMAEMIRRAVARLLESSPDIAREDRYARALAAAVCGAWSVARQSIEPSRTPSSTASTS